MNQHPPSRPNRPTRPTQPGARVRRETGTGAQPPALPAATDGRQCPECGRLNPAQSNFCAADGVALMAAPGTADPRIGQLIDGKLTIIARVGEGGLGTVYRAFHEKLGRDVAIKLLNPSVSADPVSAARFLREAQVSSCLSHENVVDLLEYGTTESDDLYLVMELLQGRTLAQLLESKRFLPAADAVRIVSQVCEGLQHAHDLGLVHRDLKPENIFILRAESPGQEVIKILDFGLARDPSSRDRLTRAGMLCGTPAYVSPEQAHGRVLDARSDVYAVGIVLYEMLTGDVPFEGDSPLETLVAQANDAPRPMSEVNAAAFVPQELEAVVLKALCKAPEGRYSSAIELKAALLSALFGGSRQPTLPGFLPRGRARIRRKHCDASRAETVHELRSEDFVNAVILSEEESHPGPVRTRLGAGNPPVRTPTLIGHPTSALTNTPNVRMRRPSARGPQSSTVIAPIELTDPRRTAAGSQRPASLPSSPGLNRAPTMVAPMDFHAVEEAGAHSTRRAPAVQARALRTGLSLPAADIRARRPRSDTALVRHPAQTVNRAVASGVRRRVRLRRARYVKWMAAAIVFGILASAGVVFAFSGSDEAVADRPLIERGAPPAPAD